MGATDWLISVDDHVVEPPGVWVDRLPKKYADVMPRVQTIDGEEWWVYEDKRVHTGGAISATIGLSREQWGMRGLSYAEMAPGCYDPKARVVDMNESGMLGSLNFPSAPRFCGQWFYEGKDKELALLCVKAWNDWHVDEWCATAPGRFIPLMLIPLWDIPEAVKEIERMAAKGVHALAFSEQPASHVLNLPDIHTEYWDPVFQACNDLDIVLCTHIGSSSYLPQISPMAPYMANTTWGATRTAGTMLNWLFSGKFITFPNLKIALAEGNIGWIPYFLERAEYVIERQRYWTNRGETFDGQGGTHNNIYIDWDSYDIRKAYHEHVFGCFLDDAAGLRLLDLVGEDNVMVEVDYPHGDTTWPHSLKLMKERVSGLTEEQQFKILRGNAERLFSFKGIEPTA